LEYEGLKHIGYNHSSGAAVYSYTTSHTLAQVLAAGYCDDPRHDLESGDIVHAFCSDYSVTMLYAGSDTLQVRTPKNMCWEDANDAATASTPISHTGDASDTYLTNDGAGVFSKSYNPHGHSGLWNALTNKFDFSDLSLNDIVLLRVDLTVTTSANNQEFQAIWSLAEGTGSAFELNMYHAHYKDSGVKPITFVYEIYMGEADVLSGGGRIRFESEDNATIKVNGWYTRVINA